MPVSTEVTVLGTGSAVPTEHRHLSGTVLRREGHVLLFDCGEGTQLQVARAPVSHAALEAVFITHLHGDHVYGLPGVLTTLALLGREAPLRIVGPEGLGRFLRATPGADPARLPYRVDLTELAPGLARETVHESEAFTVEARPIEHRVFCVGYRYQERTRPGRLDAAAAQAAGVAPGPAYDALKRGETVRGADGAAVGPEGLVGPPRPGVGVAYVLDTRPCSGGRALAAGADLLIHEATFGHALAARAAETGHSTARQAAEVARDAGAARLRITHFSARYGSPDALVAEAREVFAATDAAVELETITLTPLR